MSCRHDAPAGVIAPLFKVELAPSCNLGPSFSTSCACVCIVAVGHVLLFMTTSRYLVCIALYMDICCSPAPFLYCLDVLHVLGWWWWWWPQWRLRRYFGFVNMASPFRSLFFQMVEATPYSNPLPNPRLTNLETGAVGNSFFIGKMVFVSVTRGGGRGEKGETKKGRKYPSVHLVVPIF